MMLDGKLPSKTFACSSPSDGGWLEDTQVVSVPKIE